MSSFAILSFVLAEIRDNKNESVIRIDLSSSQQLVRSWKFEVFNSLAWNFNNFSGIDTAKNKIQFETTVLIGAQCVQMQMRYNSYQSFTLLNEAL